MHHDINLILELYKLFSSEFGTFGNQTCPLSGMDLNRSGAELLKD